MTDPLHRLHRLLLPPDIDGMNDERAEWAEAAVAAFAEATNMRDAGEDDATVLADLLADLLHWCDRRRVDFDAALQRGRGNYGAETGAEPY